MKSLIETQTTILGTIGKSKRKKEKGNLQVKPSPSLTPAQRENQSYNKDNICRKPRLKVSIENIYCFFGLKINSLLSLKLPYRFSIQSANSGSQKSC